MIPYLKEKGKWGGGGVAATPENGEQSAQRRSRKPSTATENGARGKRATGEALCKDQASKPLNFPLKAHVRPGGL